MPDIRTKVRHEIEIVIWSMRGPELDHDRTELHNVVQFKDQSIDEVLRRLKSDESIRAMLEIK